MPQDEQLDDYSPDLITLTDEDGKEFSFEVIDAADYNDERYLAVVPYAEDSTEQLEEDEFEPMFSGCKNRLGGKSVGLFGSYGWGDGQWMRDWEKDCDDAGINLVCESVICCETPDDATLEACRAMGKVLAE